MEYFPKVLQGVNFFVGVYRDMNREAKKLKRAVWSILWISK